jgi:hypothetical protein
MSKLSIYVYGPYRSGFLDLKEGTVLDVEDNAPIFDEELSIGEYSLPVDIPWTDNNRQLLNFAERIKNFTRTPPYFKCDVYDGNLPAIQGGKLTILEKSGRLNYSTGSFNASVSGQRGLFGSLIKDKKMPALHLGGPISFGSRTSRQYARDIKADGHPYISFAPVAIENFINTSAPGYTTEFLAKDTVNNIIVTGGGTADWVFGRPQSASPSTPAVAGTAEYSHYFTVPFIRLKHIINAIFNEHGYAVTGAIVGENTWDDVHVFNNYGIEVYVNNQDTTRSLNPANHVPDETVADFLKAIFQFFNIYPFFEGSSTVRLVYRQQVITQRKVLNINAMASSSFTSSRTDSQEQEGYTLDYAWDGADQYPGSHIKELGDKKLVATVANYSKLATLSIGRPFTTDDVAYSLADNMYYSVANATGSPVLWEVFSEGLLPVKSGAGGREVKVGCSTLCTYVLFNNTTALNERQYYAACAQAGSYTSYVGSKVKAPFGVRLFYISQLLVSGHFIPVSYSHNKQADASAQGYAIIQPRSLALQGADGLAACCHSQWQNVIEQNEKVKLKLNINAITLRQLDAATCVELNNVLLVPVKTERSIPNSGVITVEMMPL